MAHVYNQWTKNRTQPKKMSAALAVATVSFVSWGPCQWPNVFWSMCNRAKLHKFSKKSKFSKNFKIFKKFQNFQKISKFSKNFEIFKKISKFPKKSKFSKKLKFVKKIKNFQKKLKWDFQTKPSSAGEKRVARNVWVPTIPKPSAGARRFPNRAERRRREASRHKCLGPDDPQALRRS